jgi:high-affinity iron transporter
MLTALLIMVREGFEAALVVGIVYAYLVRIGRADLRRPMWRGVLAASALSVVAGVAIHLTVEQLNGATRLRVFAAISVIAVVVLTWMVFWMRTQARAIRGALQHHIDSALTGSTLGRDVRFAVAAVTFIAVAREGLEASLFMIAAATTDSGAAVFLGALIGVAIACLLGYLVVIGGRRLPMAAFFRITGLVLIVFAAGLASRGVMFLQSAGDLPSLSTAVFDLTGHPWLTVDTEAGKFLGAMLGWDPRPSVEQILVYLGYLGIVVPLFLRPARTAAAARSGRSSRPVTSS